MRFELPADLRLVHEMTVPMRWGDMDAMGHVNNTLYFRFMETARLDWLFGLGAGTGRDDGAVIVNAFCNFLRQLEFPGELRVTTLIAPALGRSSFDSFHRIERTDQPGVVWAEGGATIVWTDYRARKSAPLPDWFRARLG